MKHNRKTTTVVVLGMAVFSAAMLRAVGQTGQDPAPSAQQKSARVERGAHLVKTMGCNDCHTPWKMGPNGPEPDMGDSSLGTRSKSDRSRRRSLALRGSGQPSRPTRHLPDPGA